MTASARHAVGSFWRPGDDPGDRHFMDLGPVTLERGGALPDVTVAYETWGTLNAAGDNAILVEHALTGDSHVVGAAGPGHPTPGWWDGLIGPGGPLDSDHWFVVASNVLGGCQGSTGPSSLAPDGRAWGSRFPFVTIRDQVTIEHALAERLGVRSWRAVLGGSMGGMRVLEWAAMYPAMVRTALVMASTPYATADQIAWCHPQLLAIRHDPAWVGGDYYEIGAGPVTGMGIARRIAHTTYRSDHELDVRFGRSPQAAEDPLGGGGRYAVESYLDHHAAKLMGRFDPGSYVVLTEAMSSHDLARGRGSVASALAGFDGELVVAGVDSDRVYPYRLSEELVAAHPSGRLHRICSEHGHDGFLIETEQVGAVLRDAIPADPVASDQDRAG